MVNKKILEKNLYICILPGEDKVRFQCIDSSEKDKVGTHLEAVKTYHFHIVNNSKYEIEIDTFSWLEKTNFIKLSPGSMHLIEEYPYWMFDWYNSRSIDSRIEGKYEFTICFEIEKWLPGDETFIDIPVLNKKAYNYPFKIEWK